MATALIGNSHSKTLYFAPNTKATNPADIQAYYVLRSGWRAKPADPAPGSAFRLFAHPADSEDKGFAVEGYDTFVLSAVGWWCARNEALAIGKHPLGAVACPGWGYDPERAGPKVGLVSAAVFQKTLEGFLWSHPLVQLASLLARVTSARVILQPSPPPNREVVKPDPEWLINKWYGDRAPAAWLDYTRTQMRALQAVAAQIGPRVSVLEFPVKSAREEGFIGQELCNPDPFHGNRAYGAMVVDQIAAQLATA